MPELAVIDPNNLMPREHRVWCFEECAARFALCAIYSLSILGEAEEVGKDPGDDEIAPGQPFNNPPGPIP